MKTTLNYNVIKEGKIVYDSYCELKENFIKNGFSELKDFLLAKFLSSISNGKELIKYDEKIYEHYVMIIDYYKAAVKAYNLKKDELRNEQVIKIIDGINDVLECQINKFDDGMETYDSQINPILKEKDIIIDRNMKLFSKDLDLYQNVDFNKDEVTKEKFVEDIYKRYLTTVKNCFVQLNDRDSRKVTSYYYEALKQEHEALSIIIKIQADVLEKTVDSMEEEVIIQSVLMKLREGYQHLSKQINEKEKEFKEQVVYEDAILKLDEDFKNKIFGFFEVANIKNSQKFKNLNQAFTELIIKNSEEAFKLQEIPKKVEETRFFAEKVISKFIYLYEYWQKNSDDYKNTEFFEIISGISETINIKIQNIKDGILEFSQNLTDILTDNQNFIKCNQIYLLYKDYSEENIDDFSLQLSALFSEYENITRKIQKLIVNLKKDNILFEISTFEEIMNYSVSRMRESQNVTVKDFVRAIDFVFEELYQILSIIGVQVIAPKPHDLFNGKEHEVIMAEKNDNFKKGEVIKLMNSGFKEGEQVILRANIIAAR